MKKLLLILFASINTFCYSQEKLFDVLPLNNDKIYYSGIVNVDSINALELYHRGKKWFIDSFNSAKDVIQLDDKENFEIVGKGFFEELWAVTFYASIQVKVWQTIRIQCKDGRFKYEFYDFRIKYYVPADQYSKSADIDMTLEEWGTGRKSNAKKFYEKVNTNVNELKLDLIKKMRSKVQNDNW